MMKYRMEDQNTIEYSLPFHQRAYDRAQLRLAEGANAVGAGR